MKRRQRTTLQRAKIFETHNGTCHICHAKIDGTREKWELEHIIALELSHDDSDANLAPAHASCHREKTRRDKGMIAKAKRVRAKHLGGRTSASPLPGGRTSKFKKTIGGAVVLRDQ
ncbi:MAG: HNH endonuclease [Thalassovita sp.]